MMEQRHQLLRDLHLNRKECLEIVCNILLFSLSWSIYTSEYYTNLFLTFILLCKGSSMLDFSAILSEDKLPLVILSMCD